MSALQPVQIGFHASHEQHSPRALLEYVKLAQQAGFHQAMCSDHFHPWSERQGESGFAWSWLGAAMEATSFSFGTVCAPGQRYHPAIIAQAVATLGVMYPERIWLAVGTGEALNEAITGEVWPAKSVRRERLEECADVMRALWAGDTVTHEGHIKVREAKLYTRPDTPPLLVGAALTEETAEWVGSWADALVTAGSGEGLKKVVEAFHRGGGEGKPMFNQMGLSYAPTKEEAVAAAHEQWRHCILDYTSLGDFNTPKQFDDATQFVPLEEVGERIRCSSDPGQFIEWILQDATLGFQRIYLNHVGKDISRFIDAFAEKVLPALT